MAREYIGKKEAKSFGEKIGVKQSVQVPDEELDLKLREDRIGKYFQKYLTKFVFAEFSEDFLKKFKAADVMRGVPVPLRKQDVKGFNGGEGMTFLAIAENMAWVMGCDPHFKYTQSYCDCLESILGSKAVESLMKEGRDAGEAGDLDNACIHFRASLCMQPNYIHSMYSYARCCTKMYEGSKNREYIGRMKAEALDFYELMVAIHPRHAQSYYYLGYAYLNMGYYIKARLAWNDFLRFSKNNKDRKEIRHRIQQIEKPTYIEEGCNDVTAGRFGDAIAKLEPFLKDDYSSWWPLHYYLGVSYARTGRIEEAKERLIQVLKMNGSHLETMEELYDIFTAEGDTANANKYRKKMNIIRKQLDEEAEEIANAKEDTNTGIKTSKAIDKEYKKSRVEKYLDAEAESKSKLEEARAARAESMDEELAEAMKKREEERAKAKRPAKKLGKK